MNTKVLKKHLKYIVPEVRLALIKEPGKPIAIVGPEDIARFVEPLRHRSDYVANSNMCHTYRR